MAAGQKPELWGDVSTGRFAEARKFANQGKWDQAAQQYKLGGGQGFTQPQYEAFTKQYGNIGSLPGQLGEVVGQPGVPDPEWLGQPGGGYGEAVGPGVTNPEMPFVNSSPFKSFGPPPGMWGPPNQGNPNYITGGPFPFIDVLPPNQAQPIAPPIAKPMPPQVQPAPPPSFTPPPQMLPPTPISPKMPQPGVIPTNPNWGSYVQGNPDLLAAYNQGSPQSIGDWGKTHWETFGQNESRAVNPYSGLLSNG